MEGSRQWKMKKVSAPGLLVAGLLPSTQPSASSRRKRTSRKAAVRGPPSAADRARRVAADQAAFREARPAEMRRHRGRCSGSGHGVVERLAVLVAGGHAADVCQL